MVYSSQPQYIIIFTYSVALNIWLPCTLNLLTIKKATNYVFFIGTIFLYANYYTTYSLYYIMNIINYATHCTILTIQYTLEL